MLDRRLVRLFATALLTVALSSLVPGPLAGPADKKTLVFASEMAEAGSWREAKYRWEQAAREKPDDSHIANNLGVASEALGLWDEAGEHYERAVELEPDNSYIRDNRRRYAIFRERLRRFEEGDQQPLAAALARGFDEQGRKRGKVTQVTVGLPIPPRLKLNGDETILIISFLADETNFLDINREMVRYLRSALARGTAHEVLDVVPPPAVPEQRVEDLLANAEFWKYLHREFDADIIVSGTIEFDRQDASGYEDVDVVSGATGHKIRQTRFVERERFDYTVEVFFMDGRSGLPLYRDKLQRSALIQGSQNDPIQTFFELSDTISAEVLAIITTRVRPDTRTVFKF